MEKNLLVREGGLAADWYKGEKGRQGGEGEGNYFLACNANPHALMNPQLGQECETS